MTNVVKNQFGFYEVTEKPSPDVLQRYYAEKYYQTAQGSYEKDYSIAEKQYFRAKTEQKYLAAKPHHTLPVERPPVSWMSVVVKAGHSPTFDQAGWSCVGLDYSDFGCRSQNPGVAHCLKVGDVYANLAALTEANERFDLILLDNVLEHVIDPGALLISLKGLLSEKGALIVEVPNDFSPLHKHLLENGHIDAPFWVIAPDHLSYFGPEGLTALAEATGWRVQCMMTDYPIDLNLINPDTNYVKKSAAGKACHIARVEIENLIHSISPEKAVALYSAFAQLGIGRVLTVVMNPA